MGCTAEISEMFPDSETMTLIKSREPLSCLFNNKINPQVQIGSTIMCDVSVAAPGFAAKAFLIIQHESGTLSALILPLSPSTKVNTNWTLYTLPHV